MSDLVALVADVQQESTLKTLLNERRQSLHIRPITCEVLRHPRKDPGVFHESHGLLDLYRPRYARALVMLDREWSGAPGDVAYQRQDVLRRLQASGWQTGSCEVIVCDPELEMWVWSGSEHVATVLRATWDEIHALASARGYWTAGAAKPSRPKELLEAILKQQNRPRSSAIFQQLAKHVGLARCQDPAFILLRDTLRQWFGS